MPPDFLDQLAQWQVPEPPADFDRQLHERVNRSLLVFHLVEVALQAIPWALGHFAQAVVGLLVYTLRGDFGGTADRDDRSQM